MSIYNRVTKKGVNMLHFSVVCLLINVLFAQTPNWNNNNFEHKSIAQFPTTLPMPAESTHSFDVRHYRLDLQLPLNSGAMTVQERVWLTSRVTALETLSLHFSNLVCDSVKQENNNLTFSTTSGYLRISLPSPLPQNESTAIDIYYHRLSSVSNLGVYFYQHGGNTRHNICYTSCEPSDSRYWFPCYDEPWDKAEQGCQINITVPDSLVGCSNGKLDSIITNGVNHTKTYFWTHHYPISTYLMCFAASRYATFSHWFHYSPSDSMEVKYFIWPEDSLAALTSFANMVDMIDFYSQPNRYGLYPFINDKYGMVAVYPFMWGGMEHQTMTTIHRQWVLYGSESGISHELAHMWWGDMVTCQDWRNIWLNEGFATYSDALYYEHSHGNAAFISEMNSRAQDYFDEDQLDRFPVYNPPFDSLFAWGTIYCKGSWIQHMLRYLEGDTTATPGIFFQAMRAYGDSFRFSTANTEDYKRIHEQMTGLDLTNFISEWIYQAGYPNYQIGWSCQPVSDNWQLLLNISQNNGANAPAVFHIPVQILVHLTAHDTLLTIPIDTSPQRNTFMFSESVNSIVFDPKSWILKRATTVNDIAEFVKNEGKVDFSVSPNPFRKQVNFKVNGTALKRLDIFDISGKRVKSFEGPCANEKLSTTISWNGKDDVGKSLPGGIYFAAFSTEDKNSRVKLLLLK
jgi:aminopeptidase N